MTSFIKKKPQNQEMSLQITSMADIFMILLVFLLKNYATSMTNVSPTGNTKLPVAEASTEFKESLKLEIATGAVLVDTKPILKLDGLEMKAEDIHPGGHSPGIFKVLYDERKKLPNPNTDSALLVMADERTPYSTLKPILASAAGAGFVDLQLVVVQKE